MTPREAITSRPLLMDGVARATRHAGRTTLAITSAHGRHPGVRQAFSDVAAFLTELRQTAPQLTAVERLPNFGPRADPLPLRSHAQPAGQPPAGLTATAPPS
jgi:hypothetical protein